MCMKLGTILLILFLAKLSYAEDLNVKYANLEGRNEESQFAYAVLKLALEKSGEKFVLHKSEYEMSDARVSKQLEKNLFDIAWLGSSPELEKVHTYVPIPITRGMLGKRIFIINKKKQNQFSILKSIEDLKKYMAGLGIGWPITTILQHNKIPVTTVNRFEALFQMVSVGRLDYIPLGANESQFFVSKFKDKYENLAVEKAILLNVLFYDFFFYINKKNIALKKIILNGFKKAYEDGSYMKLFNSHPEHSDIKQLALSSRTTFDIDNPFASEAVKAIDGKYWD